MGEGATPARDLLQGEPWTGWAQCLWGVAVGSVIAWWFVADRVTAVTAIELGGFSLVVVVLLSLLHSLCQASVGALVGYRVFSVHLGTGKVLVRRWAGSTEVSIREENPFFFSTFAYPASMRVDRVDEICFLLAGPVVEVAVSVCAILFLDGRLGQIAALTSACVAIAHLMVYPSQVESSEPTSEGTLVVRRARETDEDRLERLKRYAAIESATRASRGDLEGFVEWARKALENDPEDVRIRWMFVIGLIETEAFAEAREQARIVLTSSTNDNERAQMLNSLAWADLMLGDPAHLHEADSASAEAFRMTHETHIAGTRAYVLIEMGAVEEGMQLMQDSRALSDPKVSNKNRAITAAILAIGASRLGDDAAATSYLQRAAELGPDAIVFPRAEAEIAQRSRSS